MKDILLVMSDQHAWAYTGFADKRIETPNLERIVKDGCLWERCYCNAPLCVPSRMSFLSGLLPSKLGIFNNDTTLPIDMPTIAHKLGAIGYETVLIGRMHFKGDDQNHGFDKRLAVDITSQYWGTGGKNRRDFGAFAGTTNRKHCLEAVGAGYSPVMAYDEMVLRSAEEYLDNLAQADTNGRSRPPVFLVVGFYGPHFPFVCRPDLYEKYQKRLLNFDKESNPELDLKPFPEYEDYIQPCATQKRQNCIAAYFGLVETLDGYVGRLYNRFCKSEKEAGREYVFVYTSDHGEQLGKRGIFGKQTLYEDAVRVPLLMAGTGIKENIRKSDPVSLLELSEGITQMAKGEEKIPEALRAPAKPVCIQQILDYKGKLLMAEAVIQFPYKIVRIDNNIRVFHLLNDPEEKTILQILIRKSSHLLPLICCRKKRWLPVLAGKKSKESDINN